MLAAQLVANKVSVIVATPVQAALQAKAAAGNIPLVFAVGSDPVQVGLVPSFNRPGGTVTGVSWLGGPTLGPKRIELLHELVPAARRIAVLCNPANTSAQAELAAFRNAAAALALDIAPVMASNDAEIEAAFAELTRQGAGGLVLSVDALFNARAARIAALAAQHRVPAMYTTREFVEAGGLMSYGTSYADAFYTAGNYAGRILNGFKPGDLPVVQAAKVEFIVNRRAAEELGVALRAALMQRANEVI